MICTIQKKPSAFTYNIRDGNTTRRPGAWAADGWDRVGHMCPRGLALQNRVRLRLFISFRF